MKRSAKSTYLPNPKSLHKRNHRGETALHLACKRQDLAQVKALIKTGIEVNCPDFAGWTALHEATATGNRAVVKALLEAGAHVNARSMDGDTPLHDAALSGSYEVVKLLLEHGANPLDKNVGGRCALDKVTDRGTRELLQTSQHPATSAGTSCLQRHNSTQSSVCETVERPHRIAVRQSGPKALHLLLSEVHMKLTKLEALSVAEDEAGHTGRNTALWDIHTTLTQVLAKQHIAKENLAQVYRGVPDCLRKRLLKRRLCSLASVQIMLVDIIQKQMQAVEEYVTLSNNKQRHRGHCPAPATPQHQQSVSHTVLPTGSQRDNQALRSLIPAPSTSAAVRHKKTKDKRLPSVSSAHGKTLLFSFKMPSESRPGSDLGTEQTNLRGVEEELCSPSILNPVSAEVDGLALVMKVQMVHVIGDDELVPNALMNQYWDQILKEDNWAF